MRGFSSNSDKTSKIPNKSVTIFIFPLKRIKIIWKTDLHILILIIFRQNSYLGLFRLLLPMHHSLFLTMFTEV